MSDSTHQRTILLVEDEAIVALAEKALLERHGYRVIVARNGEKAIEAVTAEPGIDLVLMDIDLGSGMRGTEAARAILELRDLPLAFLSSHVEPEVVAETEDITSYGYIVKNSGEMVLLASIRMAFRLFEAKQETRRRGEQFHALVSNIPGTVFRCLPDAHWTMLYLSAEVSDLSGYPASDFLHNAERSFSSIIHPADVEDAHRWVAGSLQSDQSWQVEYRVCHRHGEVRWAREIARGVPGSDGSIAFIDGIILDITEYHHAEQRRRESELKYRRLFEAAPVPMLEADFSAVKRQLDELTARLDGDPASFLRQNPDTVRDLARSVRILNGNRAAATLYELESGSEFASDITQAIVERSPDTFVEELLLVATGARRFTVEQTHVTQGGRHIEVELHCSVVPGFEADFSRVHISAVDITDRVRTANEVRTEADLQRLLLQLASRLIDAAPWELDRAVEEALSRIAAATGADGAFVFEYRYDDRTMVNTHEWAAPGVPLMREEHRTLPMDALPALVSMHERGEPVLMTSADEAPEPAVRELFELYLMRAVFAVPLTAQDRCLGFVAFDSTRPGFVVSQQSRFILQLFAEMLTGVKLRQQADVARRKSEDRLLALVETMPDLGFVVDEDGTIREVFATSPDHLYRPRDELLGKRFSDVLPRNVATGCVNVVQATLASGASRRFDYQLDIGGEKRCYEARTADLGVSAAGPHQVFVVVRDITDLKNDRSAFGGPGEADQESGNWG